MPPAQMAVDRTSSQQLNRLLEAYEAFADGRLERIPDLFDPEGFYRTSGMFPGMRERYVGHEEIATFWHAATEAWERLEIEVGQTIARDDRVVAQVWLDGRGLGSGIDVRFEAGTSSGSATSGSWSSWHFRPGRRRSPNGSGLESQR